MNLLVKSKMEISSNLVAFSKNTNFKELSQVLLFVRTKTEFLTMKHWLIDSKTEEDSKKVI